MTDAEKDQAEKDANDDAKFLVLLLLLGSARVIWNSSVGRFYVDGRAVSIKSVRMYLARIETKLGRRLQKLTNELAAGRITLEQWHAAFEKTIRTSHVLSAALALGSIAAAVRNVSVNKTIAEQLAFADAFADEIRRNRAGSVARIKARAVSYVAASFLTFEAVQLAMVITIGYFVECRRILRANESCKCCIYWTRWTPVNEMPPIGSLTQAGCCGRYDRCYLEYR